MKYLPKSIQMKNIWILTLSLITFQMAFSQSADELNLQSQKLFKEHKPEEAYAILKKAAELGSPEAQYNLGYILQSGILEKRNLTEAVEWYKKSSDNNFNDGHYAMMMVYGNGEGVEANVELAFDYALKCANNNDPTCMWNVVNCYISENGTKLDIPKLKEWIFKLARLPNPENLAKSTYITSARLELARFYHVGDYFEKDLYQSYLWYLIYNESKVDFSVVQQEYVIKQIQILEKLLNKNQLAQAKGDAEKLINRKLVNFDQLNKISL